MNHYGLLQTMSSANKNTKYNVELSYGETILIKRNRGPIDTMGQQKNLKSLQNRYAHESCTILKRNYF